ncbi:MAG: hypothetical protein ACYC75_02620 [Minisyncoccota bacterium]
MNKTEKIVIGVVVAAIVIGVGYMFLRSQDNTNPPAADQTAPQQGSPSFGDYINRALHQSGILPGGHGGGG